MSPKRLAEKRNRDIPVVTTGSGPRLRGKLYQDYNLEELLQTSKIQATILTRLQEEYQLRNLMNSTIAVCRRSFQFFLFRDMKMDTPSAMLELLGSGCHINRPDSNICNMVSRNILTTMVDETVEGASSVLSNLPAAKPDSLSVFIPQFICRTALLFLQKRCTNLEGTMRRFLCGH